MQMRKMVAILVGTAFLFAATAAFAGTGKLKIVLKNEQGAVINAKVVVKKGTTVKTCNTSGGTCTIPNLAAGSWTVSAKTASGSASGGPKTVSVVSGKTGTVTLLVKSTSGGR
jgi:plastocyanin